MATASILTWTGCTTSLTPRRTRKTTGQTGPLPIRKEILTTLTTEAGFGGLGFRSSNISPREREKGRQDKIITLWRNVSYVAFSIKLRNDMVEN
jgi:hypothetical protein